MKIRFIIVFLLLISCTSVDKSSEDNAVTEENIDICEDINNLDCFNHYFILEFLQQIVLI